MGCVTLRVVHHVFGEFDEWYEMAHPRVLVTVLLMTGLGSSNDWNPLTHPPEKRSNRSRSVTVEVPAGNQFQCKYLGEGGEWFCDPDADAVEVAELAVHNSLLQT